MLLVLPPLARADFSPPEIVAAHSVSGLFVVTGSPQFSDLAMLPAVATNQEIVRLEPGLLAVSAERIKDSLLQKLGVDNHAPWRGTIYLALHPARSLDENVAVFPSRFEDAWIYHVLLPDALPRARLVRTLTSVLLSQYANQNAGEHCAEVPSWLVEGLTQELVGGNSQEMVLSAPDQTVNGIPLDRVAFTEHAMDSLDRAREVLQTYTVLTFTQMSWPTDLQLSGEDGGVYRASAQLFVDELLGLRDGAKNLRTMLQLLPRYYNWQTAFQVAFHNDFSTPLEVEKWWALQSVVFDAQSPGPQWTAPVSREKLDDILSVAVEYRSASNNLPVSAEVSLQQVIQNFDSEWQHRILQLKLRDLELAQFRMAPSLAVLAAQYRNALAEYLGDPSVTRKAAISNKTVIDRISGRETIRKLNALDAQRRAITLAGRGMF